MILELTNKEWDKMYTEDKEMKMNRIVMLILAGSMLLNACGTSIGENTGSETESLVIPEVSVIPENLAESVDLDEIDTSKLPEDTEESESSEVPETLEGTGILEEPETPEVSETSEESETPEEPETSEVPEIPEILEPVYTYQELNIVLYAKASVNVRTLPSTDGEKIGALPKGAEAVVTGQCNETGWYRISYNGQQAYVSNNYLVSEKPQEEVKKPAQEPEKEYSMEDLDGDGKADLAEYTTWNDMTVYTEFCTPSEAAFKRDLCYAGLYVPMKYTNENGGEIYYMLLDKSDELVAEEKFKDELWKIGVASQVSSVIRWTKDGEIIAIWSTSFLTNYEFEVEITETIYDMEYYVVAKGKPQVNYWIIIMNGYEEDTFPYMIIGANAYYPDEEYGRMLSGGGDVSLPNENGEYIVTAKVREMKPGRYVFKGYYFGGMTITDHGLRPVEEDEVSH